VTCCGLGDRRSVLCTYGRRRPDRLAIRTTPADKRQTTCRSKTGGRHVTRRATDGLSKDRWNSPDRTPSDSCKGGQDDRKETEPPPPPTSTDEHRRGRQGSRRGPEDREACVRFGRPCGHPYLFLDWKVNGTSRTATAMPYEVQTVRFRKSWEEKKYIYCIERDRRWGSLISMSNCRLDERGSIPGKAKLFYL
jgi:hypothetical protein